ncbi:hypothetical protein GQ600_7200 [Phytophthora cactorum]|nr:hypothetical protein GQ600_7200 [Phytophthora cactorum]
MAVLKKKEVEVKPKLVSLKSVKAQTPPASVTKAVAVGLRRSPSRVKGASSEMRKELSVARSQWKSTESQTSSSQKPSPRHIKVAQSKLSVEKRAQPIQKERTSKLLLVRKSEPEKVSSSRRTEHSKSPSKRRRSHSRSPSIGRRKRSKPPSSRQRTHSRSPSRQKAHGNRERSASPARRYSRRSPSRFALMKDEAPDRDHHSTITTQEGDRVEVTNDLVALRRPERIIRRAEAEVAVVAGIAMAAMTSGSIVTRARAMTREI